MRKGLLALLPLALLLGACWQADALLMPDNVIDRPQFEGTYYGEKEGTSTTSATISQLPNGFYRYLGTDPQGGETENYRLRLDRLSGEWYLAQANSWSPSDYGGFYRSSSYFVLLRITGNRIEQYDPGCGDPERGLSGVDVSTGGDCTFLTYRAVNMAALARLKRYQDGDKASLVYQGGFARAAPSAAPSSDRRRGTHQ